LSSTLVFDGSSSSGIAAVTSADRQGRYHQAGEKSSPRYRRAQEHPTIKKTQTRAAGLDHSCRAPAPHDRTPFWRDDISYWFLTFPFRKCKVGSP
jgi:hypothetical protein